MPSKRIVLVTYGSLGDVQPMLALTLSLKDRGHDVILAGPPEKQAWARGLGCPFHPLGNDVTAFLNGMKNAHSIDSAIRFMRFLKGEFMDQFCSLKKVLPGANLAVGASLAFSVSSIAESMKIPYRYVAFTPQLFPSGHHPFPAFRRQDYPRWLNRMTWRIQRHVDRFHLTALLNAQRQELGLEPIGDAWRHVLGSNVVVASDKVIARVPRDVKPAFTQTGYLHLNQPDGHLPELERFLSEGPRPVYAGFGSMPKADQARLTPIIVSAIRSLGLRAVIARFWEAPSRSSETEDVFFISKYPHVRLFPRMAAVIHHGGAGTTACAARSGVPQLIIPHILDQFYWGHKVYKAGLGPRPIWRSRLNVENLKSGLYQCTTDAMLDRTTQVVARQIDHRESIELGVDAILGACR